MKLIKLNKKNLKNAEKIYKLILEYPDYYKKSNCLCYFIHFLAKNNILSHNQIIELHNFINNVSINNNGKNIWFELGNMKARKTYLKKLINYNEKYKR